MSVRRLPMTALLAACVIVPVANAQKNEISGLIGRTFISDQGIENSSVPDNTLHFGKGLTFEANYARTIMASDLLSLSLELPFVVNPDEDLKAVLPNRIPQQYRSFMVTPAARLGIFPNTAVFPWFTLGGGLAYYSESSTLLFGGANPGKTGTATGALQAGGGLDVKLAGRFTLRGEFRDFWTGVPQLDVNTGRTRQHNYFVGAGLVWHF